MELCLNWQTFLVLCCCTPTEHGRHEAVSPQSGNVLPPLTSDPPFRCVLLAHPRPLKKLKTKPWDDLKSDLFLPQLLYISSFFPPVASKRSNRSFLFFLSSSPSSHISSLSLFPFFIGFPCSYILFLISRRHVAAHSR